MLNAIVVSIRFILLILGGQKQVALENAALRQQLAVFKRNVPRPKLNSRSIVLDRPLPDLAGLEIRFDIRAAGNRNFLASPAVQTLLVEVIPTETTWPSTNPFGGPDAHPQHGTRKSDMGSTTGCASPKPDRVINLLILPSDGRRVIPYVGLTFADVSILRSRLQWSQAGRLGKHRTSSSVGRLHP